MKRNPIPIGGTVRAPEDIEQEQSRQQMDKTIAIISVGKALKTVKKPASTAKPSGKKGKPLRPENARFNQAYLHLLSVGKAEDRADFAAKLNYAYTHVAAILSGARDLSDKVARSMQRVFGISDVWLMRGSGDMEGYSQNAPISDCIIYHIPYALSGKLHLLSTLKEKLSTFSLPGLQGEYYSLAIDNDALAPIKYGSLLILQETDSISPGKPYMIITPHQTYAGTVRKATGQTISLQDENINRSEVVGAFCVVTWIAPILQ